MGKIINFLRGSVLLEIAGAFPERFLNLCATEELGFWAVRWQDSNTVQIKVTAWDARRAPAVAQRVQCECKTLRPAGLPAFLWRFRKRYALLLGLCLSLAAVMVLSRFILTVEVTGNQTVPTSQILTELKRQGVKIGAFGPAIDERQVSHGVLLELPELSWLAVNLHGSRAEVIVREREPKPDIVDESIPADVVASGSGIITHLEVTRGRALCREGDTVLAGEVLITGTVDLVEPEYGTVDLGYMTVRASGRVMARTWRTLTAEIPLTAQVKVYTGEETTRFSLGILGGQVNFYGNSGISFDRYDKIRKSWCLSLPGGQEMPLALTRETVRAYSLETQSLDQAAATELLKSALSQRLQETIGQGQIVSQDFALSQANGLLTVRLQAECQEEIGKTVEH